MLTPSQLHDLTTNAPQRTASQWAVKLRADFNSVKWIVQRDKLPVKRKQQRRAIDIEVLRSEATNRTHQEWADYFGVTKERMYVVCSNEGIKVKNSYGLRTKV